MPSSVTGARPVADYARLLMAGSPKKLADSLDAPMLVWNAPEVKEAQILLSTRPGGTSTRPAPGSPIAYELKKGASAQNVFAMGVTVGRTENNDIVLDDNSVSRFHAFFQKDRAGNWKLVDAESRNGTWVGPLKLTGNKPQPIKDEDKIRFGEVEVTFYSPQAFVAYLKTALSK